MTSATGEADSDLVLLETVVDDIFASRCDPASLHAARGCADLELMRLLDDNGFTRVGLAEDAGGAGGALAEAAAVVRRAGRWGAAVPLADSLVVANPILAAAGLDIPEGVLSAAEGDLRAQRVADGWRLRGRLDRVAYGSAARHVVAVAVADDGSSVIAAVPIVGCEVLVGRNLADEPADTVVVDTVLADDAVAPVPEAIVAEFRLRGALSRSLLIAGALEALVPITVEHAKIRQQFGRPIAAFQAVQQHIVVLAGEAAAARAATNGAVRTCSGGFSGTSARVAVAAAKIRTAQAATAAAAAAHQVHGAIGMTREHNLHLITTRLWSWRTEWGGERRWARELGRIAISAGGEAWALITGH